MEGVVPEVLAVTGCKYYIRLNIPTSEASHSSTGLWTNIKLACKQTVLEEGVEQRPKAKLEEHILS